MSGKYLMGSLTFLLLGALAASAASLFPHAVLYPADQDSLRAVADFNGDGKMDVLLTASFAHKGHLSVLPGVGGGKLGPAIVSPDLGYIVSNAVVGDLNGDGVLDVVTSSFSEDHIETLGVNLGNGDGTFHQLEQDVAGGSLTGLLLLADVNNDGYLDVVITTFDSRHLLLTTLMNAGDGSLLPAINSDIKAEVTKAVVGDFNHDGNIDLAGIDGFYPSSTLWSISGNGDGTFQPAVTITSSTQIFGLTSGDFNSDGNDDLVIVDWELKIEVWNGNADGTFQSPKLYDGVDGALSAADFNGDGLPDLFLDSFGWSETILINKGGNSGFGSAVSYRSGVEPQLGVSSALGTDLDGDGRADIVVNAPNLTSVGVLLNHGQKLSAAQSYRTKGTLPRGMAVADFNNDGRPDIAVGDDGGITLFLQRPNGLYSTLEVPGIPAASQVLSGDFNGDHNADLALTATGNAEVLLGNGDATFGAPKALPVHAYEMAIGDFDGDQKLDVAATIGPLGLDILKGKGDGTFGPPVNYPVPLGAARIVVTDVNHDGKRDLVVAYSPAVSQLLGNGDGSFGSAVIVDDKSFVGLKALATADVNNDGNADLLLVGSGSPRVLILYLGKGDGSYQAKTKIPLNTSNYPIALAVADFNRDGFVDVVVGLSNEYPGYIPSRLLLGKGDGTFQTPQRLPYTSGVDWYGVATADMNVDGWPDLLLGDSLLGQIVIVPNVAEQ
jgi:hypothetical protein